MTPVHPFGGGDGSELVTCVVQTWHHISSCWDSGGDQVHSRGQTAPSWFMVSRKRKLKKTKTKHNNIQTHKQAELW